ncbi:peroxynitrite isomerase THAP4 [Mantella aurantiaca]
MSSELSTDAPPLNPAVSPLSWMLGTWVSDPCGEGEFPTIPSFRYIEKVVISHVGQPVLNFTFCSSNFETGKPLHRECGFIRMKPGTNQVAFICAQNLGVVEVEEGEVQGEQLTLTSNSVSRMSFAKEPHVQKICRTFCLTPEGKLEQKVSMATSTQAMASHLRVTYKKVSS